MKILLLFMAVASVFKFVARAISSVFQYFKKEKFLRNQFAETGMAIVKTVANMGAYIDFKGNDTALYAMPKLRPNMILQRKSR